MSDEKTSSRCSCCIGVSRKWVLFMNGFVLFGGLVLLIMSIFNSVNQGDVLEAIGEAGIVGPIISGALLVVIAALGCCGVLRHNKFLLVLYLISAFILAVAFLAIGIVLTFLVKDLNNIDGEASNTLSGKVESRLNDVLIALFNECCAKEFNLDRLLGCSEAGANLQACFTFEETYVDALQRVESTGVCNTLKNVEVNGFPVVGDPLIGGCAGGNGVLFKQVFTQEVEDALIPLGAVFITTGVLILLTIVATCIVLCTNQEEYFDREAYLKAREKYGSGVPTENNGFPPPTAAVYANRNTLPPPNTFNNYEEGGDMVDSGALTSGVSNPRFNKQRDHKKTNTVGF